jgi:hypothetical protein
MRVLVYQYEEDYGGSYIEFIAKDINSAIRKVLAKEKELCDYTVNQCDVYISNLSKEAKNSWWHNNKKDALKRYEFAVTYVNSQSWDETNIDTFCLNKDYGFTYYEVVE